MPQSMALLTAATSKTNGHDFGRFGRFLRIKSFLGTTTRIQNVRYTKCTSFLI